MRSKVAVLIGFLILLFSLFAFVKRKSPLLERNEIVSLNGRMEDDKNLTGGQISGELLNTVINEQNIPEVTYKLTRLITLEEPGKTMFGESAEYPGFQGLFSKRDNSFSNENIERIRTRSSYSSTMRFVLGLYEQNFGNSKEILNYFVDCGDAIPYFDLILIHAGYDLNKFDIPIVHAPGLVSEKTKEQIKQLLSGRQLIDWAKRQQVSLKQYSGMTNTVIGIYDWISFPDYKKATGFEDFPNNFDSYYDLGGGFATPDIDRLTGLSFTSLDIVSPREAQNWNLSFQILQGWLQPRMGIAETRMQSETQRSAYLKKLSNQKWQYFDVFESHFPTDRNSYFITSFGFLSSTVGSLSSSANNKVDRAIDYYSTSYMAVRRIVELVALGKKVTLFTYQRATARNYRFRTIFLNFNEYRLVSFKFWPDQGSPMPTSRLTRLDTE